MELIRVFENPKLTTQRNTEFNEYRKIGKFTDLTLKSTDGKTIKVHKIIISASCPYFESMFNCGLMETCQQLIQLVDDVTIADLEILIEYIYTGRAEISLENAENLAIKAQYFKLIELQIFCSEILIDNINRENCLDYWRKSRKYLNNHLKAGCINFIKRNCKSFLEFNVMVLTAEEFKTIMSEEGLEINTEELYKIATNWLKEDFESRNVHLMEFINCLDFTKVSFEFIKNEILSDNILKSCNEFLEKIVNIGFEKYAAMKNEMKSLKNIFLITNWSIYKLNWNKWEWMKQFHFEDQKIKLFATSAFKDDILISDGDIKTKSNFLSWNILSHSNKINYMEKMLEKRLAHEMVVLKEKVYCCGGWLNNGSTEVFDFEYLKWTKGPTINENKYNFALITLDNSLYALGGYKARKVVSHSVEQYDLREGHWNIISGIPQPLSHATILSNEIVHCFNFDGSFSSSKFDLRNRSWYTTVVPGNSLRTNPRSCDIIEFNNKIFGVIQTHDDHKTWGTFNYDTDTNKWNNLQIPLNLNVHGYRLDADIRLCIVSD